MFAEALAGSLGYPVLNIKNADFTSSFIGESIIKLKACFHVAMMIAPCVLFFGECISIILNTNYGTFQQFTPVMKDVFVMITKMSWNRSPQTDLKQEQNTRGRRSIK